MSFNFTGEYTYDNMLHDSFRLFKSHGTCDVLKVLF